jgi:hypothetical protein
MEESEDDEDDDDIDYIRPRGRYGKGCADVSVTTRTVVLFGSW